MTPTPTDTLIGISGTIKVGDQTIATKAQWSMKTERDYIDATGFGAEYRVGLRKPIVGFYEGAYEGAFDPEQVDNRNIYLYGSKRPAWWGRLKHWILQTPWPEYVFASGEGELRQGIRLGKNELHTTGQFRFTGPVTLSTAPRSCLERIWSRLCWRIRHPLG